MKNMLKSYIQPSFLICTAVLAIAAVGKQAAVEWLGWRLTKEAIPLQKPLDMMDKSALVPYEVYREHKIKNKDILEQLGTEDYLQWDLLDTEEDEKSPVKHCSFFITYYTGNPDQVPHVPEECYTGAGNEKLSDEMVKLSIDWPGQSQDSKDTKVIKAKYLVFGNKASGPLGSGSKYPVIYFFNVNGRYAGNRNEAREILSKNLLGKYSYFSKVEWKFYGTGFNGIIYPNKEEALEASEKIMSVLLPLIEDEHWPDWEKANNEK